MNKNRAIERKILWLALLSVFFLCACDAREGVKEYKNRKGEHFWYCTKCLKTGQSSPMHGNVPPGHPSMNNPMSHSKDNRGDLSWKWAVPKQWHNNDAGSMSMARYTAPAKDGKCECSAMELGASPLDIVNILRGGMGLEPIGKENLKQNNGVWITGRLLFQYPAKPKNPLVFWQGDLSQVSTGEKIAKFRSLLAECGQPLSENATIKSDGKSWLVEDGEKRYSLLIKEKNIYVYNNLKAVFVDISGSYHGMNMQKTQKNYRMLGAVVATDTGALLIKMVGPQAAVEENFSQFMSFCQSFKLEKKQSQEK